MRKIVKPSLWLLLMVISLLSTGPVSAQVANATVKINGMI